MCIISSRAFDWSDMSAIFKDDISQHETLVTLNVVYGVCLEDKSVKFLSLMFIYLKKKTTK